jgi:flagellar hook-associated protein 1 FlgK
MTSSLLSIGQSALFAAQAQLATTSHNIANASTPGYNRQVVAQTTAGAQNEGYGFVGQGTTINDVSRVYDQLLSKQVLASQTSSGSYTAYTSQITPIDNVVADASAGLTPALQGFFKGLQDLTANPNADASRQAALSDSQTLVARFQSLAAQFTDSRSSVNDQITSSLGSINSYASQIATLNGSIAQAQAATGKSPNDLLDQRDQIISQMNQILKVTTEPEANGALDVFVGNGQPVVLGNAVSQLVPAPSPDDPSRLQVGISSNGNTIILPDKYFSGGGSLGGVLDFRSNTLDVAQNTLGQIATVMASKFNDQNKLGLDQNGNPGGNFFTVDPPVVIARTGNSAGAALTATVTDATKLTTSDYRMQFDGTNYTVTRLSDGVKTTIAGPPTAYPSPAPQIDGVTFAAPTMAAGDSFTVKPTANGASSLTLALAGTSSIATAAPITTAATTTNTGTGTISPGTVDKTYLTGPPVLPLTATFGTPASSFTITDGTPSPVTTGVTINGVAATSPYTFTAGATISYGGVSFVLNGAPAATDTFTVAANTNATKDSRNVQLMAALQTAVTVGSTNFQGAYSSLVSMIGNKANEVNVLNTAEKSRLNTVTTAQQSESGVNQDEELANMLRYQNAYQAGAKIIQAASDMLNVLFTL